jgi:hypothetical protein
LLVSIAAAELAPAPEVALETAELLAANDFKKIIPKVEAPCEGKADIDGVGEVTIKITSITREDGKLVAEVKVSWGILSSSGTLTIDDNGASLATGFPLGTFNFPGGVTIDADGGGAAIVRTPWGVTLGIGFNSNGDFELTYIVGGKPAGSAGSGKVCGG